MRLGQKRSYESVYNSDSVSVVRGTSLRLWRHDSYNEYNELSYNLR